MAAKLPKEPQRAWRNVVAAVREAMAIRDFQGVHEVRAELVEYQGNLGRSPAERLPWDERRRQLCAKVWDALLGMGFDEPLDVLDKVEEEFGPYPDLDAMQRAASLNP